MKNIRVDNAVFSLKSGISAGLISALTALQSKGCHLFVTDEAKIDETVKKILTLENILISPVTAKLKFDYTINVTNDKKLLVNDLFQTETIKQASVYIISLLRSATISRNTKETQISVSVSLDSKEESLIQTGIGFFDHMLDQIARHANIYLNILVKGDLNVDEHHTVEDTGIALGMAISEALGDKKGIKRFGFLLPMDDSIAYCALDLSGRAYLKFKVKFKREMVGEFPTELTEEFFRALSSGMKANLFLKTKGDNDHHKIESLFKSFAKALNDAIRIDERTEGALPSTKGVL